MRISAAYQLLLGMAFAASANACHTQRTTNAPAEGLDPYRESLVRAVPLDSLGKLHRAMLLANNPKPIAREIVCEEMRLSHVHGTYIVSVAAKRLRDSLFAHVDRAAYDRMDERLAGPSLPLRVSDCHVPTALPKAADSLNIPPQRDKP
jgi:hypothetical protein